GAGGDGDRDPEGPPVQPGGRRGNRTRRGGDDSEHRNIVVQGFGTDGEHEDRSGRHENSADEGEQEQDRGQGHPAPGGEEGGEPPRRARHRERAERRRAVAFNREIRRLTEPLADPANREQQDRGGDRDEYVIEAGDEPELLFIGNGNRALLLDMRAK